MREEKLLALGPRGRLLHAGSRDQLLAPYNLIPPAVIGDDQSFSCCHNYHQMIHTIPNPVKLFL